LGTGGRPESNFWLQFIPYAGLYWAILSLNNVSRSFGKDADYAVGLFFLPWVFASMLSYGQARYWGPSYVDPSFAYRGYPQPGHYQQPYGQQYPQPGGYPRPGTPRRRPESGPGTE
jgi:hypothetical protein